jgi:hypothetical protein
MCAKWLVPDWRPIRSSPFQRRRYPQLQRRAPVVLPSDNELCVVVQYDQDDHGPLLRRTQASQGGCIVWVEMTRLCAIGRLRDLYFTGRDRSGPAGLGDRRHDLNSVVLGAFCAVHFLCHTCLLCTFHHFSPDTEGATNLACLQFVLGLQRMTLGEMAYRWVHSGPHDRDRLPHRLSPQRSQQNVHVRDGCARARTKLWRYEANSRTQRYGQ